MKPSLLLANDDGITSPFLPIFARELARIAEVEIVVPAAEQSWIGRAYNRHNNIKLGKKRVEEFVCHTVEGTPSDSVNIALAHICKTRPTAVVSGLNIGQNIAFPLLWSSGTFAAAVEGAGHGLPAFAFSMRLEHKYYDSCRIHHNPLPQELRKTLETVSAHAAQYIVKALQKPFKPWEIHNINYPSIYTKKTPFKTVVPAKVGLASLWNKNGNGELEFKYATGAAEPSKRLTDIEALAKNYASRAVIFI